MTGLTKYRIHYCVSDEYVYIGLLVSQHELFKSIDLMCFIENEERCILGAR